MNLMHTAIVKNYKGFWTCDVIREDGWVESIPAFGTKKSLLAYLKKNEINAIAELKKNYRVI